MNRDRHNNPWNNESMDYGYTSYRSPMEGGNYNDYEQDRFSGRQTGYGSSGGFTNAQNNGGGNVRDFGNNTHRRQQASADYYGGGNLNNNYNRYSNDFEGATDYGYSGGNPGYESRMGEFRGYGSTEMDFHRMGSGRSQDFGAPRNEYGRYSGYNSGGNYTSGGRGGYNQGDHASAGSYGGTMDNRDNSQMQNRRNMQQNQNYGSTNYYGRGRGEGVVRGYDEPYNQDFQRSTDRVWDNDFGRDKNYGSNHREGRNERAQSLSRHNRESWGRW